MRAGALGDALLLRRAIYALKRGGCTVALLAPAGDALEGRGPADADRLLPWSAPESARLFTDDPHGNTGPVSFDAAIAYTRNATLALNLKRLALLIESLDPQPPRGAGHASEWFARPASTLGFDATRPPPTIAPTVQEADEAQALAAPLPAGFLALHPGSGSPDKNWPVERFGDLARRLSGGRPWLLVGGPADEAAVKALRREPGAIVARDVPLRVLGALLSRAGAYVGNDSGVTHLAAAWGAPTVALFGPTDPATWAPLGAAVEVVRAPTIREIPTEAVAGAVARIRSAAGERPCG